MKIIINGKGGHGIKFGAEVLGRIAMDKKKEVSISYSYDAAVRGQNITAFITIAESRIKNPVIEKADLRFEAEDFEKTAINSFGSRIYTTMLILGKIIRELGIEPTKEEFTRHVTKNSEANWKAMHYET